MNFLEKERLFTEKLENNNIKNVEVLSLKEKDEKGIYKIGSFNITRSCGHVERVYFEHGVYEDYLKSHRQQFCTSCKEVCHKIAKQVEEIFTKWSDEYMLTKNTQFAERLFNSDNITKIAVKATLDNTDFNNLIDKEKILAIFENNYQKLLKEYRIATKRDLQ